MKHSSNGVSNFADTLRFRTSLYGSTWLRIVREIESTPIILEKIRRAALQGETSYYEQDDVESIGEMAPGEEESDIESE